MKIKTKMLKYCMEKLDARKISATEQQELRDRAIKMKEAGRKDLEIAEELNVNSSTISNWWSRYNKDGNITIKKRGRREGTNRAISKKQEKHIIKQITSKTPKVLKLADYELWTRQAVKKLIPYVSKTTLNNYLKDWKFAAKFPQIYDTKHIKTEEEKEFEKIDRKCEVAKAEVNWLEKKTYVLESNKKIKINMIYSVTKKNKLRFMLYEEKFSDIILIEFLNRLIKSSEDKICLILNNLNMDTKIVNDWMVKHQTKIVLCHFTSYKISTVAKTNSKTKSKIPRSTPKKQSQPTLF